jgi:hypothetical protein
MVADESVDPAGYRAEMSTGRTSEIGSAGSNVLAFVLASEKRQAEYFWALLKQHWIEISEQIALDHAELVSYRGGGDQARRVVRRIAGARREQAELERLLDQLERRFFPSAATPAQGKALVRCFDVSVQRHGSRWAATIAELGEHVSARSYHDVETVTRAHISAVLDAPMSQIAVSVLGDG